jgi:hypothetical protein
MGERMKKSIFTLILLAGLNVFAGEPSLEQVTQAFFRHAGMNVSNIDINAPENILLGTPTEELFFDYNGVTYNCYVQIPQINYNRVHQIYNVHNFMIKDCNNYQTGADIDFLYVANFRRAQGDFINGMGFYNNNTRFETTSALYSRERIGNRP